MPGEFEHAFDALNKALTDGRERFAGFHATVRLSLGPEAGVFLTFTREGGRPCITIDTCEQSHDLCDAPAALCVLAADALPHLYAAVWAEESRLIREAKSAAQALTQVSANWRK